MRRLSFGRRHVGTFGSITIRVGARRPDRGSCARGGWPSFGRSHSPVARLRSLCPPPDNSSTPRAPLARLRPDHWAVPDPPRPEPLRPIPRRWSPSSPLRANATPAPLQPAGPNVPWLGAHRGESPKDLPREGGKGGGSRSNERRAASIAASEPSVATMIFMDSAIRGLLHGRMTCFCLKVSVLPLRDRARRALGCRQLPDRRSVPTIFGTLRTCSAPLRPDCSRRRGHCRTADSPRACQDLRAASV